MLSLNNYNFFQDKSPYPLCIPNTHLSYLGSGKISIIIN